MHPIRLSLLTILLGLLATPPLWAGWASKGELALEGRVFLNDDNAATIDQGIGMMGRVHIDHRYKSFKERLRVYGRLDQQDPARTILVLEEAWVQWKFKPFKLKVGFDLLNWTATEAFHPADIFNSRNLDSDLQNYEKVGEPMVSLAVKTAAGKFTLYHMPTFVQPILPSPASRLSFAPGQELGVSRLDVSGKLTDRWFAPQFGLRWRYAFDNADISLHGIHHQDRSQPSVIIVDNAPSALFQTVTQVGGTYQHVVDAFILKLEAAWRIFHKPTDEDQGIIFLDGSNGKPDHGRVAFGLEYGLAHEAGSESTLILEAQTLVGTSRETASMLDTFQADVLLGYRFAFNDASSTSFVISGIADVEHLDEFIGSFSCERRFGDTWIAKASVRVLHTGDPVSPLEAKPLQRLRESDYVGLQLTRHF